MRFLFLVFSLALFGCAKARQAQVAHNPVKSADEQTFSPQNLTLTTNVLFLWKKGVTAATITEMSRLGDQFGQLKLQRDYLQANGQPVPPELQQGLQALHAKMTALTERFTVLPLVKLTFVDEKPTTEITGWDAKVEESRYEPKGGRLNVFAKTEKGEIFELKLARNKYELAAKGLVSFYGDVVLTSPSGEKKFGVMKLLGPKPK